MFGIPSITLGRFISLALSSILEQMLLSPRLPSCGQIIRKSSTWQLKPRLTLLASLAYFAALVVILGTFLKQITDQGEVSATNANGLLSLGWETTRKKRADRATNEMYLLNYSNWGRSPMDTCYQICVTPTYRHAPFSRVPVSTHIR